MNYYQVLILALIIAEFGMDGSRETAVTDEKNTREPVCTYVHIICATTIVYRSNSIFSFLIRYRRLYLKISCIRLFLCIIVIVLIYTFSYCRRKCTMLDDNADCWKKSLDYFTYQVQKSVRDYAALLTHINYWLEHLSDESKGAVSKDMYMFEESSLNRTLQFFNSLKEGQKAPLDDQDMRAVFEILINKVCLSISLSVFVCQGKVSTKILN